MVMFLECSMVMFLECFMVMFLECFMVMFLECSTVMFFECFMVMFLQADIHFDWKTFVTFSYLWMESTSCYLLGSAVYFTR